MIQSLLRSIGVTDEISSHLEHVTADVQRPAWLWLGLLLLLPVAWFIYQRQRKNLATVPPQVERIVFPVSIYEADARGQSFGQVSNAFIRIVNQADNQELARYDLSEDASTETAMVFGELYRNNDEWKFRAVGQGYTNGLAGIARDFGVNVG